MAERAVTLIEDLIFGQDIKNVYIFAYWNKGMVPSTK